MRALLSLAEINVIEQAYTLGVPSLGKAADELLLRWRHNLRDAETAMRLVYLCWYRCCEPLHLTGLEDDLPSTDAIIAEFGDEEQLTAEMLFSIGMLAYLFPYCLGDETTWQHRATIYLQRATTVEPTSPLFRNWPYFIGDSNAIVDPEVFIRTEVHARFHGRGAFGEYMKHLLIESLR